MRPPHLCTCGRIVAHGTRCQCRQIADRERKSRFDKKRPSARARGYNRDWDKARIEYLAKHPACRMPGCSRPASLVDHIKPHKQNPVLFWDRTNWQPLCTPCHSRAKQRMERNQ